MLPSSFSVENVAERTAAPDHSPETLSPLVQVDQVTKRYGRLNALDNVSLRIPAGTVFALLGENGAGKTTLIKILTGFVQADSGSARLMSLDARRDADLIRKRVGYVSDHPALYPWMRVSEIGWFAAAFYDPEFLIRYDQLIAEFEIDPNAKIKHLSKGGKAKAALALAMAHDPELLILDEPTSGLDPMVRRQFLESMVERAAAGRTVLLSSHHIDEVERVADWVGIVHQGQVPLIAPLDDIRQSHCVIVATLDRAEATLAPPGGVVLNETQDGRQFRWVIRDVDSASIETMRSTEGVLAVERSSASLEDVMVAVCAGQRNAAFSSRRGSRR